MAGIRYTGGIGKSSNGYKITIELDEFPTMGEATELGEWLHTAILDHLKSKGAVITNDKAGTRPKLIVAH